MSHVKVDLDLCPKKDASSKRCLPQRPKAFDFISKSRSSYSFWSSMVGIYMMLLDLAIFSILSYFAINISELEKLPYHHALSAATFFPAKYNKLMPIFWVVDFLLMAADVIMLFILGRGIAKKSAPLIQQYSTYAMWMTFLTLLKWCYAFSIMNGYIKGPQGQGFSHITFAAIHCLLFLYSAAYYMTKNLGALIKMEKELVQYEKKIGELAA